MQENTFVEWLRGQNETSSQVIVGIGDDGAILPQASYVVVTDMICEGVHFLVSNCQPEQIGHKALGVNLSDLAAMAAKPSAAFVSLAIPRTWTEGMARRVMEGIRLLGLTFDCTIAGGDTNIWDGPLVVNVAALGLVTPYGSWLRSGAKPGDLLVVTGELGGSLRGKHLDFTPRVAEALQLNEAYRVHAAMDVSDGIALDLRRLAQASRCGVEIDVERLPISPDVPQTSPDRWLQAMTDGEDFELVLAMPDAEAQRLLRDQPLDVPVTQIGKIVAGNTLSVFERGVRLPWPCGGYEHGSTQQSIADPNRTSQD